MRIKAFLLVLACSVMICSASLSEGADILLDFEHPFQYAVDNDCLWIKEQSRISQYSTEGELMNLFDLDSIEHIASSQGRLYAQCNSDGISCIMELTCESTPHRTWELPQNIELQHMEITNDNILFLAVEEGTEAGHSYHCTEHKKLYILNMLTGSVKKMHINGRDDSSITSFATDGKLVYAIDSTYNELITINIVDGSIKARTSVAPFEYICYDRNTCSVFGLFTDSLGTSLIQIDPQNGEFFVAYTLNSEYEYAGLRGNESGLYVGNYTDYNLLNIDTRGLEFPQKDESIYFINSVESLNSPRLAKATENLIKDYPGFKVVFRNIGEPHLLVEAISSDDSKCDIVAMQEHSGVLSRSMLLSGAICDLNTYADIVASLDGWINLDSTFLLAGKRFGLPQDLIPYFWYVNEELFSKLQLSIPDDGWTWNDFFTLCNEVEQLNQTQEIHYYVLADDAWPYLLRQFYINRVNIEEKKAYFNTPEFRSLISSWKNAVDSKVILLSNENEQIGSYNDVTLLGVSPGQYAYLGNYKFVCPPLLEGSSLYPIQTVTLVLGCNSTKKDETARFLSYYVSPEFVALLDPCYQGVLLNDMTYYYNNFPDYDKEMLISSENSEYWIRLLEHSSQEHYAGAGYVAHSYNLLTQYMNEDLELNDFILELQNATDVALGQ